MTVTGGPVGDRNQDVVVVMAPRRRDGGATTVEQLATGLMGRVGVLVVSATWPTPREGAEGVRIEGPGMARLAVPARPVGHQPGLSRLDAAVTRRGVRRALVELGSPTVRAVIASTAGPFVGRLGDGAQVVVAADDLVDGWAIRSRRLERELRRQLLHADVVVAGSPTIAALLALDDVDALVIPDGLDDAAFDRTRLADSGDRSDPDDRRPAAVFVGDLAGDVDLDALHEVARAGPDVLLIGPGPLGPVPPDVARLLRRSNVEWVGPSRPDELPHLLARGGVGLVPLRDTSYTRSRLALDALVHLAAGSPVVGTDCEPIRWLRDVAPNHVAGWAPIGSGAEGDVVAARDPEELAEVVVRRLAMGIDAAAARRRRGIAARHRWSVRAEQLADAIGISATPAAEVVR